MDSNVKTTDYGEDAFGLTRYQLLSWLFVLNCVNLFNIVVAWCVHLVGEIEHFRNDLY